MTTSKAHLAKCEGCPLEERPVVYGDPEVKANFDVVVVGEAPGVEEVNEGRPFVGKSGQLLRKVLEHNGIDPNEVYYTNACLCHPPTPMGKQEPPKTAAINACRERLLQEIRDHSPKHVIAVGAVAAKALLKAKEGITILRKGQPVETKDGYKVIPTFHTAAALRSPDYFPSIVSDIGKVNRIAVGWEPTQHKVATLDNAQHLLKDQLEQSELLAGDIELGDPIEDIHNPNLLCIGISHRPGHAVVYPAEVVERIVPILDRGFKDKRWAWQNGKFDIKYLWSLGMTEAKVDEDTMLASYACDERKGVHDLETISTEKIGAPYWKEEAKTAIKEENTLGFLDPETLWRYNATDADVTHRLIEPLHREMESDGVAEMYREILIPASAAFADMEYQGMKVDLGHLDTVESEVIERMETLEEPLHQWVDNPRSPQQVLVSLNDLGYRASDTTADTLASLQATKPHPFIEGLLGYRKAHKIYSTYVKGLRKNIVRGRVHPSFLLHGTETGRTSCRRPNMQNIPIDHPVRESFTASEGNVLVEADYGQIELRVAATLAQDEAMRQVFLEGKGIHRETATAVFGPNYSAREYVHAKSINFGIIYGETAKHLAYRLGMDVREAKALIERLFRRFPQIKAYKKHITKQIYDNQYLTSVYGRKRRFWLITRDNAHDVIKEGVNFTIQSAASDILLTALIKMHRERPYLNPIVAIHDSLIFDIPQGDAPEAEREIIEIMESVNPLDVPIVVEAERSFRWKMKQ